MTEDRRRILEMVAEKKITIEEATRLLELTNDTPGSGAGRAETAQATKPAPKYIRVVVHPNPDGGEQAGHEHVNIRVPLTLIRAGIKLTGLIPAVASERMNEAMKEKGIDLDLSKLNPDDLEQLVDALAELEVDVRDRKESVRVYLE